MADTPIIIPKSVQDGVAATLAAQAGDDKAGMQAATAALPGPMRDVFSPAPDIIVSDTPHQRISVRRFVDRDFVFLSALGHPLNRFSSFADRSYSFEPSGELAWQLCWLLTRPVADIKAAFKTIGAEGIKEAAADEFGELPIFGIGKIMEAIAKQMTIYASAHLEYEPNETGAEGEKSSPKP